MAESLLTGRATPMRPAAPSKALQDALIRALIDSGAMEKALENEREIGLDFWAKQCPTVDSIMPTLAARTVLTATLARFFQTLADQRS